MQSNELYYLSALEHVTSDYLNNFKINKKRFKKCAILNLNPWTQSIGHFVYLDSFIKGVILGILDYDAIKFSDEPKSIICNKFLYKKYEKFLNEKFKIKKNKKYFFSTPNMDAWRLKNKNFVMSHKILYEIQKIWIKKNFKPIPKFSSLDHKKGKFFISKILNNKSKWFVSLHVREAGYRFNDHLWLDTGRNANLENFKKTISYINKNKGLTVRLGEKKSKILKHPGFFDYGSSRFKSDFLDIYLLNYSKFHIGSSSGLSFLSLILEKYKNIYFNMSVPFFVSVPGSIITPKLFVSTKNNKLQKLSIYEKFDPPLLFTGNEVLKNLNLKQLDNSPDDICNVVKEFYQEYQKKNWKKIISNNKSFLLKKGRNLYCQNQAPLSKMFITKYKNLL